MSLLHPSRYVASANVVYEPKVGNWDCAAHLDGLTLQDVALDRDQLEPLREFFWFDLCAEHDAQFLHQHLLTQGDAYGEDFWRMEAAWFHDEMNHFRGFRVLYHLLFAESYESIDARLSQRRPNFAPLAGFFGDEFRLACLIAYDELATTRAYHVDFDLYRSLGHPKFLEFIQRLTRDESFHYQNAVALMRRHPRQRFEDLESIIEGFVRFDLEDHSYAATFLFDHDWGHIEAEFYRENGKILHHRLCL